MASPGEEFSLRAVCVVAGVKMPTLYHFFGSKQGLIDAVVEHGFDLYLGGKASMETSGDPIQDIRSVWDAHVKFGLANPGFYTLMYGTVSPGHSPAPQSRLSEILRGLTTRAAEQNRLVVSREQAAAHVLVATIGVTHRQIILAKAHLELSQAVREGTIAAITGTDPRKDDPLAAAIEIAATNPETLGRAETQLPIEWLTALGGRLPR